MLDWDESRELFDSEVNVSEAGVPGSVSTEGRAGRIQHEGFGCLLVLPKRVLVLPVAGRKEARIVTRPSNLHRVSPPPLPRTFFLLLEPLMLLSHIPPSGDAWENYLAATICCF